MSSSTAATAATAAKHITRVRFYFRSCHSSSILAVHRDRQAISTVRPALPSVFFLRSPPSLSSSSLDSIKAIHALSITSSASPPLAVFHALISGYAAQDDIRSARELFDRMPQRTAVSYNSLIAACARCGRVDEAVLLLPRMMRAGLGPTRFTFSPILSIPGLDHDRGVLLHSVILKSGLLNADPFSATALLTFYGRNSRLDDALNLFEEMPCKTVVSWNSIISVFSQFALDDDCMFLFRRLLRTGIGLTECSFLSILSAFSSPDSLVHIEQIHGLATKISMDSFIVVANALINVLCYCCSVYAADRYFKDLIFRDVVSWNTLITGSAKNGVPEKALELFLAMLTDEISPSEATFASVINACTELHEPDYGELIHAKAIKYNLDTGIFVSSSLINFYASSKSLSGARRIFDEIPEKCAASWNALISGHADDDSTHAMILLKQMLQSDVRPNEFSFSSVLRQVALFDLQQLHSLITRMGYSSNQYVSSAIIASYTYHGIDCDNLFWSLDFKQPLPLAQTNVLAGIYNRTGRFQDSRELLLRQRNLDSVSWNIFLTACARNRDYSEAFQSFTRMQISGYRFDKYTAISLVSCSSKIGSLVLGRSLHGLIIKTNSGHSETFVCNVLLDMYAKCGHLEDCLRVFEEIEDRNLISWTALISGLGLHGHSQEALGRFKQMEMEGFQPDGVALLAVLSAFKYGGLVEEGWLFFQRMKSDYKIEPEMDHYICLVELLCKYGHLKEAELVISGMPFQPNAVIWRIFLQGCKEFGNNV